MPGGESPIDHKPNVVPLGHSAAGGYRTPSKSAIRLAREFGHYDRIVGSVGAAEIGGSFQNLAHDTSQLIEAHRLPKKWSCPELQCQIDSIRLGESREDNGTLAGIRSKQSAVGLGSIDPVAQEHVEDDEICWFGHDLLCGLFASCSRSHGVAQFPEEVAHQLPLHWIVIHHEQILGSPREGR